MKRNILKLTAIILATSMSLWAQDISFEDLYNGYAPAKAVLATNSALASPKVAAQSPSPAALKGGTGETYDWLVMVFINGRNNLWRAALMDVNEMEKVGSTSKVAVSVELGLLQDKGNSTRFFIQKDNDESKITSPGQLVKNGDMGSWKHFVNFAKWSIRKYPAKRYMLVLWNHGSGRIDIGGADNSGSELGIAYDDLTRNFIRNNQIAAALKEIGSFAGKKVDIYSSDACLMQMLSVTYEISDYVDFAVQSEEIVPGAGFPYDTILSALAANPGASARSAAKIMVDKYNDFYEANKNRILNASQGTTISTINSAKFAMFNALLNDWIKKAVKSDRAKILSAVKETLSFEYGYKGNDTSMNARSKDLYDFVDRVNSKADKKSELYAAGKALQKYISGNLVIRSKTTGPNNAYARAKGLAVYFPKLIYDSSYDAMLSSRDTLWDDFIKWVLDENYKVR